MTYLVEKRAFTFSIKVIQFLKRLPRNHIGLTISRQVMRSATSIGANITEGCSAYSKKELSLFLTYSLKSANETVYWLKLLKEGNVVHGKSRKEIDLLVTECQEIAAILASSILKLKKKNY